MTQSDKDALVEAFKALPAAILRHENNAHRSLVAFRFVAKMHGPGNTERILTGSQRRRCCSCGRMFKSQNFERIGTSCGCVAKIAKMGPLAEQPRSR